MPWVYLLTNRRNGTLYVGVTSDLVKRVYEHKAKLVAGFSERYGIDKLVWFEETPSIEAAIERDKQIKEWKRNWKLELIERSNPYWNDLYDRIL